MKTNPFYKVLAPLLKCKKCKDKVADPKTGLCRECEILEMVGPIDPKAMDKVRRVIKGEWE